MQLFHQVIADNARRYPTKPAIILDGQATSYRELQQRVDDIASLLATLGILPGDRLGLYAPISIDLIASYLGMLQAGVITAATHHTLSRTKLIHQLKHSGARVLITDCTDDLPDLINEAGLELVLLTVPIPTAIPGVIQLAEAVSGYRDEVSAVASLLTNDPERPTSIFYTSGSTFNPKGVLVNHRIMLAASSRVTAYLGNEADDRILSYSTLASDYGVYNVMMPLYAGATSVIESRPAGSAEEVLAVVEREAVTAMHVFPPVFCLLANAGPEWQARVPGLRYISSSGQALHSRHIQRIRQALPQVQIFSNYGLTECKRVSYLPPEEIDRRPTSVGKPLPGVSLYLLDEHDRVIDQPGQVGELLVTSDYLMLEYWDMPEANARAFVHNAFGHSRLYRTGDLFKQDAEGYLYYVARKDDVFARNIWNVNPREIEQCLASHPAVAEVLVVPVADESAGHVPKACIVLDSDHRQTSGQTLIDYCKAHLDWHMVPTQCVFLEALPKTDSGKFSAKGLI
ncbi:acyl--CoA ligase [Pseudomonas syringae pv. syringae]|uniref:AMP-dependent synthetase and ligase n=1 Tax=Pseudomonas syringae pv. solidagae TaxID=264458 RepID=A0A0P9Z6Y8_PSESX|nr:MULTISPECIES: class I adenylate-forming enzyme family protein [Pseudomonas]AVB23941.1 AMP-dependent synthetase [Pseudomonas syringae pv. syringae]KPB27193.1 AMP-dependent synthetase and ligase [Pseudomonas syringae pv. syringae]KPY55870.1 AMP-dependent synthetase and ligase [Pseudomonas syringae pv. solidagae]MCA5968562.1 acyl--CoA ligase [Pseudomonas sp. P129]MCF5183075.1 AMP-binding protein [Pseudomonas syringae]